MTPNEFELHANSRNKHPADNIYLENGKTFRHILSACEGVPLDELEKTIKDAIGSCSRQQIDDANKYVHILNTINKLNNVLILSFANFFDTFLGLHTLIRR